MSVRYEHARARVLAGSQASAQAPRRDEETSAERARRLAVAASDPGVLWLAEVGSRWARSVEAGDRRRALELGCELVARLEGGEWLPEWHAIIPLPGLMFVGDDPPMVKLVELARALIAAARDRAKNESAEERAQRMTRRAPSSATIEAIRQRCF